MAADEDLFPLCLCAFELCVSQLHTFNKAAMVNHSYMCVSSFLSVIASLSCLLQWLWVFIKHIIITICFFDKGAQFYLKTVPPSPSHTLRYILSPRSIKKKNMYFFTIANDSMSKFPGVHIRVLLHRPQGGTIS